jgi:hypothetical protein
MDPNFDSAYPENLPFVHISARDFSNIRSNFFNRSGHGDIFILDNWLLCDVLSGHAVA